MKVSVIVPDEEVLGVDLGVAVDQLQRAHRVQGAIAVMICKTSKLTLRFVFLGTSRFAKSLTNEVELDHVAVHALLLGHALLDRLVDAVLPVRVRLGSEEEDDPRLVVGQLHEGLSDPRPSLPQGRGGLDDDQELDRGPVAEAPGI